MSNKARKFKTTIAAVAVAAFACIALAGCSLPSIVTASGAPEGKDNTLASGTTITDGVLTVGVNASNAPYGGTNSEGEIVGIDVDIAAAVADELGCKLQIVDIGTRAKSSITSKKADIVMGVTRTSEGEDLSYSNAYLNDGVALYCVTENAPKSILDVDYKGTTVAVVNGSNAASVMTEAMGDAGTIATYNSADEALDAVVGGKANYAALGAVAGDYTARDRSDVTRINFVSATNVTPVYAVCAASNTDLYKAFNEALSTVISDGNLRVITDKWLGTAGEALMPGKIKLDAIPAELTIAAAEETTEEGEAQTTQGQ